MTSAERHTRQGCARGQRFGTLDRENVDFLGPWSWSGVKEADDAIRAKSRSGPRLPPALGSGIPGHSGLAPETEDEHLVRIAAQDALNDQMRRHTEAVELAVAEALSNGRGWGVVVLVRPGTTRWEGDRMLYTRETRVGPHPRVPPFTVQVRTSLDGRVDPRTGYWFA